MAPLPDTAQVTAEFWAKAIKAAQAFDHAQRPPLTNWTRVGDNQVRRLLAGALPVICEALKAEHGTPA